jgi:methylenetetrahydrofolate reductase (NADPH)
MLRMHKGRVHRRSHAHAAPRVSFEFFPPRSLEASFRLWDTVRMLAPLTPEFVSVTYGAGGTTRQLTHEAVTTIGREFGLNVAAHLTCVDATRDETLAIARAYAEAGVREIVALRGDPPKGPGPVRAASRRLRRFGRADRSAEGGGAFTLRVGAYPEPHPEAAGNRRRCALAQAQVRGRRRQRHHPVLLRGRDLPALPRRLRARRDRWRRVSCPGSSRSRTGPASAASRKAAGATVPAWLDDAFEKAARDGREQLLATALCTELCDTLMAEGWSICTSTRSTARS